jgi:hypothetical protein
VAVGAHVEVEVTGDVSSGLVAKEVEVKDADNDECVDEPEDDPEDEPEADL